MMWLCSGVCNVSNKLQLVKNVTLIHLLHSQINLVVVYMYLFYMCYGVRKFTCMKYLGGNVTAA